MAWAVVRDRDASDLKQTLAGRKHDVISIFDDSEWGLDVPGVAVKDGRGDPTRGFSFIQFPGVSKEKLAYYLEQKVHATAVEPDGSAIAIGARKYRIDPLNMPSTQRTAFESVKRKCVLTEAEALTTRKER